MAGQQKLMQHVDLQRAEAAAESRSAAAGVMRWSRNTTHMVVEVRAVDAREVVVGAAGCDRSRPITSAPKDADRSRMLNDDVTALDIGRSPDRKAGNGS